MRLLNEKELWSFHDTVLGLLKRHGKRSFEVWGFPSGNIECETYEFRGNFGSLLLGHDSNEEGNRWWIPVNIDRPGRGMHNIAFEMNIPKTSNRTLSVHYARDESGDILILHKGFFTVGYGGVSMDEFFSYYRRNPATWQRTDFDNRQYLLLGKLKQQSLDASFLDLISSLAAFARYIAVFKNQYRRNPLA